LSLVTPLAAIVGASLYGYLLTTVNLPEQWGYWLFSGMLLGLLIGHWYVLIASLAPLVFFFTDSGAVDAELLGLVLVIYIPGAFLAILLGIGGRKVLDTAIASWGSGASSE
jgi:hypothetical protein